MVFDTNSAFKAIPYVWGDYIGESFEIKPGLKATLPYLWSWFWWIFTIFDFFRYFTLAVLPPSKHGVLEYYLADYCSAIKGNSYRLMIMVGPLYNIWLLSVMYLFNKLMSSDKRYQYWLRYLQMPMDRSPENVHFVGYSKERLTKFWKLSSSLQNIHTKAIFFQAVPAMASLAASYLFMSQKFSYLHRPWLFWTILITNFLSLISIGTMNLLVTIVPVVYLYLNCKILRDRFTLVTEELEQFTYMQGVESSKVDKCLHDFNRLIDELHRSNFFWSRFVSFSYHIGLALCSILLLVGLYSDNLFMIAFSAISFVMTFISALLICAFLCGDLHIVIKKAYRPLTNLLANKQLKFPTTIRIVRLLGFITSEHAGIRAGSFFLVRKQLTLHIFLELCTNVVLLLDLLTYIRT